MTNANSSDLPYYGSGERVLIGSCTPLEAALRYVSPDGLKINKDKPAVSLKSNPLEPFDYWLCRTKGLPQEAGSLVRDYHHGPPKDPSRVNLSFLEDVVRQAKYEVSESCYGRDKTKMEQFLKALFRKATSTTDHTGTLNKLQTLYFPITDGLTGCHLHPSSDKGRELFVPGQHVHFIQDGKLLHGIVKDVFKEAWPIQYSIVRQEDGPGYLVSQKDLVTHKAFQLSMPTQDYIWGVDYDWMRTLQRVFEGFGAKVSVVDLWACFHSCRCFSMTYDRLSWVRNKAETDSSHRRGDMIMVPKSELVIQSYLKERSYFEKHWEPFRIKEWVQNVGSYSDGAYAIIPEMREQSQVLFKGYALKVEVDDSFLATFPPRDEGTPPAKKCKTDAGK